MVRAKAMPREIGRESLHPVDLPDLGGESGNDDDRDVNDAMFGLLVVAFERAGVHKSGRPRRGTRPPGEME